MPQNLINHLMAQWLGDVLQSISSLLTRPPVDSGDAPSTQWGLPIQVTVTASINSELHDISTPLHPSSGQHQASPSSYQANPGQHH